MPTNALTSLFLTLALLSCTSAGAADANAIRTAIDRYNGAAREPLPLPDAQVLAAIAGGEAVNLRERKAMTQADGSEEVRLRVVGYRVVRRPRLLVWLATLDIGTQHSKRVTEYLVSGDDQGGSLWYQHLNTPWPVRNRHWIIRNGKNIELARRTDDFVWEHGWRLESGGAALAGELLASDKVPGLKPRDGARAIYLTVNRGAWTMLALDADTTLVAAHTAAVMGGWIPASWVATFVGRQLHAVLDNLEDRSNEIHASYTGEYAVFTGAGERITPAMARASRRAYDLRQPLP